MSDEDTCILQSAQTEIMQKITELNEITRKMQRIIGMMDPSSETFAKMYDMLPYPHTTVYIAVIILKIEIYEKVLMF